LCFFAGGVANAVYAGDNADLYDEYERNCDRNRNAQDACDTLKTVRDSEGAAAVSVMCGCVCVVFMLVTNATLPCTGTPSTVKLLYHFVIFIS